MTAQCFSMVLWEYKYVIIIIILPSEVGKQQGNILVLSQIMIAITL